jgi:DNA helicase-2/ATP-dependent DNA helicase PcrA
VGAPPEKYVLRRDLASAAESFRIDYRNELNEGQLRAVQTVDGPVLVVAGAGTGKTRTLVYRVARMVERGIDPSRILLLTFTRKAAAEMLRRASSLLDGRCERIAGGTFHSFANLALRRHGGPVGLQPGFTILDRGDSEDVINLLRAEHGLDRKDRRFPRKQAIAEIIGMAVNKSLPLETLIDEGWGHLAEHTPALLELAEAYRVYKRERQLVDYDDLLVLLRDLLRDHPEVRSGLSRRHSYIMVDEYQDTNALQAEIVRLLADQHDNVMAVGDDAQSIYSFRGADFRNIMDFARLFPGTRVIALEENYRSTQPILDLTNAVIRAARERHEKTLFTRKGDGQPALLVAGENEHFQSRFVCQRILDLREEGVPLSEIAVLIRSSFHSFGLELELTRHDIPFVKRGGFKFLETAHIKDAIAHVRVLLNPRDTVSWHRILLLLEGIGPRTSEEIIRWVLDGDDPATRLATFPRPGLATDLAALGNLLARIRDETDQPETLVGRILEYYDPLLKRLHPDDHPKRQRDLEHFATMAARYQDTTAFLADMALEPPSESVGDVIAGDSDEERLVLSTIHSAKGLEWHTVFVLWAAEGRFPSPYCVSDDDIEEERRLMYVATTRAREQLYLTYPITMFDRHNGVTLGRPSRFIADLPEEVLRPLALVEELDPWDGP